MLKLEVFNHLDKKKMQEIAKRMGKSASQTMAEKIYEESQANCPVESGTLKNSGYIKETKHGFQVGYTAPYAEYVDKMPQKSFNKTGNGGKTHFLSGPFMKYRWGKGVDDNDL